MPTRVPSHRPSPPSRKDSQRAYDRLRRNPESKRFYAKQVWRSKVRSIKLHRDPACERCLERGELVQAVIVHHIIEITADMDASLDIANMQSLCRACHNSVHAQANANR